MELELPLSFPETVRRSAARDPNGVALVIDDDKRTFAELVANSESRAREMLGLGLVAGDRIGVLMPNSVAFVEILLGASMVGVVTVPINTRFKAVETAHIVADSEMSVLYSCDGIPDVVSYPDLLGEALPGLKQSKDPTRLSLATAPKLRSVVTIGAEAPGVLQIGALRRAAHTGALPPPPDAEHPLLLMYTSGTTAKPKGCILPHRAMLANARAIGARYAISANDVWWCPLPMFHVGGLLFMTIMLHAGGRYVGMSYFTPEQTFDLIERERPSVFYPLFPTIALAVTEHPRFASANIDSIRYIFSVATPDVQHKLQSAFSKATLFSAFGMTETCGTVTFNKRGDSEQQRMTTCGVPLEGWQIKIVDPETRQEVATGVRGEIAAKGVGLFKGYFRDEALTAKQFTPDGYFLTGDIGAIDADGLMSFFGRLKDQLKVGGENVSALEVESFIATHPAVKLAQVVGLPDAKYGEVPVAYLELKAGQSVSEAEIIAFCTGKIARFKIPRHVRFVSEWPMSATKILKYRLRERILAELGMAG